jgi:hypothetical protein
MNPFRTNRALRTELAETKEQLRVTRCALHRRDSSISRANRKIVHLFADVKQLRLCLSAVCADSAGLDDGVFAFLQRQAPVEYGGEYVYHDTDVQHWASVGLGEARDEAS